MKRFLLVASLLLSSNLLADLQHIDRIAKSSEIFGKSLKAEDLKDKVILFQYWGIQIPHSVEGLTYLQSLQNKFGKTGKFKVKLSHQNFYDKDAIKALFSEKNIDLPCYQQLSLPNAPLGAMLHDLPTTYIIDAKGNASQKYKRKDDLKALESKIQSLLPKSSSAGVENSLFDSASVKYNKGEVVGLKIGRPIKRSMAMLARKAMRKDEAGKEAQEIIDSVNSWGEEEMKQGLSLLEKSPVAAYEKLAVVFKTFQGMPLVKELPAKLKPFTQDKYFN